MSFAEALNLVWPLTFLLAVLLVIRKLEDDFKPVIVSMVGGLATHAQSRAVTYVMALMLGTAASLQALGEVARSFNWVYVEAFAKIANPGVVAVMGFLMRSPTQDAPPPPPKPTVQSTTTTLP